MVSWDPDNDHRLVQTAVLNRPGSEDPVILPTEKAAAERFRQRYPGRTFWCGTLLGGCGGQLSDKIYGDRVCHFAHHAYSNECTRQGAAESADHLYASSTIKTWLGRAGLDRSTARYDGDLSSRTGCLRVVLEISKGFPAIGVDFSRNIDDYLRRLLDTGDIDLADWLIKDNRPLAHALIDRNGYALQIRFRDEGLGRSFEIGTQTEDLRTYWHDLSECTFTRGGIRTPILKERRLARLTVSAPRTMPPQEPVSAPSESSQEDETVTRLRRRMLEASKRKDPRLAEESIEAFTWKWPYLTPDARSELSVHIGHLQRLSEARNPHLRAQRLLQEWRAARTSGQTLSELDITRVLRSITSRTSTHIDSKHKADIRAELERSGVYFPPPVNPAQEQADDIARLLEKSIENGATEDINRLQKKARRFRSDKRIPSWQQKRLQETLQKAKKARQRTSDSPRQKKRTTQNSAAPSGAPAPASTQPRTRSHPESHPTPSGAGRRAGSSQQSVDPDELRQMAEQVNAKRSR